MSARSDVFPGMEEFFNGNVFDEDSYAELTAAYKESLEEILKWEGSEEDLYYKRCLRRCDFLSNSGETILAVIPSFRTKPQVCFIRPTIPKGEGRHSFLRKVDLAANLDLHEVSYTYFDGAYVFELPENKKESFFDMIKDKHYGKAFTFKITSPLCNF